MRTAIAVSTMFGLIVSATGCAQKASTFGQDVAFLQ